MKYLIIFFATLMTSLSIAQNSSSTWNILGKLTFKKEFDASLGYKIDKPVFGEEVKALANKTVEIKG